MNEISLKQFTSRIFSFVRMELVLSKEINEVWKQGYVHRLQFRLSRYKAFALNTKLIKFGGVNFRIEHRNESIFVLAHLTVVKEIYSKLNNPHGLKVLDIGANCGQFGIGIKTFDPDSTLISLEPNPFPYKLLKTNSEQWAGWDVHCVGVDETSNISKLHFVHGKSGQGSLFLKNANLQLLTNDDVSSVEVKLIGPEELQLLTYPLTDFDLVKIDVEGYELKVLRSLGSFRFKYLLIEINTKRIPEVSIETVQGELLSMGYQVQSVHPIGDIKASNYDVLFNLRFP
jgi:FkbM family methyltransferase